MERKNRHIEIAQLFISSDAHILRGLLEAEDITVFLFNEGYSSLTPADALLSGGIKLHVPFDQIERAEPIVEAFFENLKKESQPKCYECGSTNLKHDYVEQIKYSLINLFSAIGGANASHGIRHFKHCLDCGCKY